jgi:glycosyltransferase involved in cell wall biosynthesis
MEQLSSGFLESDEYYYLDIEPIIVRNYRVIIFFRCPCTKTIEEAILLAKSLNKKVLFDIDDLVIDKKYTELIPYLKTLSPKEKKIYDNGVKRMRKTLKLCEEAITTTKELAKELKHYVSNVYINKNVASEEMWKLSNDALKHKEKVKNDENIIIGYFSGSITHNSDIEMIKPALIRILSEFKNVHLLLFGELSFPNFLNDFSSQIMTKKFTDWRKLPEIISSVDINIAPIEKTIFNAAKSENKWVEAALVKVPSITSNYGEFKNVIIHNETGLLCSNINDWYISLKTLIINKKLRKIIGKNAYKTCKKKYNSIYTGRKLVNHINSIANKHIGFFLPSLSISGGIYVILKHACYLKDEGWDVDMIIPKAESQLFEFEQHTFNIINLENTIMAVEYDIIVATLYSTLYTILNYYRAKKRLYLVQNYETDFYPPGHYFRSIAEKTYSTNFNIEYITISKWCEKWLWNKYRKKSKYAPNGIDLNKYNYYRRELKKSKIRILIEGDSSSHYKNVDESFEIVEKLDKNKFEIWYLSYNGKPKDWYRVDKFLNKIPFENVSQVYDKCDILLKSSWLESFSYPPLEMMATGGFCVVAPNGGNKEYLKDGENCLFYKLGNINSAVKSIERLISDEKLQQHLYENGLKTARNRDWKLFKNQIISLYDT